MMLCNKCTKPKSKEKVVKYLCYHWLVDRSEWYTFFWFAPRPLYKYSDICQGCNKNFYKDTFNRFVTTTIKAFYGGLFYETKHLFRYLQIISYSRKKGIYRFISGIGDESFTEFKIYSKDL